MFYVSIHFVQVSARLCARLHVTYRLQLNWTAATWQTQKSQGVPCCLCK